MGTTFAASTGAPTTLAAAEIGDDGSATYRFYFDGTSAPLVGSQAARSAASSLGSGDILFTGGLALVLEPMATSVMGVLDAVDDATTVVIDVNCREAVIPDRAAYVERIGRAAARADIVKVSDEDLTYLTPTLDTSSAAQRLLDTGAQAVVVTAGSLHTTIVTAAGQRVVEVPAAPGEVVDTIGAGDTFGAGLLAWWSAAGSGPWRRVARRSRSCGPRRSCGGRCRRHPPWRRPATARRTRHRLALTATRPVRNRNPGRS